jgi:hypothetical protein
MVPTATGRELVENAPSVPWTDSITRLSLDRERLTFLILRDGQRDIPCCLQMRFIVVGQTVKCNTRNYLRKIHFITCYITTLTSFYKERDQHLCNNHKKITSDNLFKCIIVPPRLFAASFRLPVKYCWRTSRLIIFSAFPRFLSFGFFVSFSVREA